MLARARAAALIALVPGLLRASEQVGHPSGLGASHRPGRLLKLRRERRRRTPRRRPLRHFCCCASALKLLQEYGRAR